MSPERSGYINVDQLMPQVTIEQAASYYGVLLPELRQIGEEVRAKCFLNCGLADRTGDRALAIRADHPAKQWKCHQYGCGRGGNLVSLCDLMKPGAHAEGRPRGERFKAIAADLKTMVEGTPRKGSPIPSGQEMQATPAAPSKQPAPTIERRPRNLPLARSDNERARGLVNLDEKFVTDPGAMPPAAARYFRRRPFLSSEVCLKWRMGYLPRNAGGDNSGGTMRGKIVYPILSERGEVLTWFGRDPDFEEKHAAWEVAGRQGPEPEKFRFTKGFHRGQELFGQQVSRLSEPGRAEAIRDLGIVVVEGPNDVIALETLGVPSVALCSNTITESQVDKLASWAARLSHGHVTLMLDCDEAGENGTRQALSLLAEQCHVRLAWSDTTHGGAFKGRQPESLTSDEWETLRTALLGGN